MSGKIIRKIAAAGACALVAASSCAPVSAFGHSYYLPEAAEMSITVPGELITITRNASDGDSYFTTFHQDYAATMEDFQTNNIYLQGMDNAASLTVTVTTVESAESQGTVNYNQLTSEQLSEIAKSFLKDSSYTACRVDTSGKDVNWLQFDTNINGTKGLLANTVVDGKSINVSMYRNGSDISEDDGKAFSSMTSGIRFGERSFFEQYGMMILVAIAAILVVAVIAMIILRIVRSRGSEKPTIHDENERILEELAGKYARKPITPTEESKAAVPENAETAEQEIPEAPAEAVPAAEKEDISPGEEQIAVPQQGELLGAEDIDEFIDDEVFSGEEEPLEAEEPAEKEADRHVTEEPEDDDFFAGSDLADEEAYETIETETPVRIAEEQETVPEKAEEAEEIPAEVTEDAAEEQSETDEEAAVPAEAAPQEENEAAEDPAEEPEQEAPGDDMIGTDEIADEATEDEEPGETDFEDEDFFEEEPDEFEEYMNDEVLVRQDVKSNKFRNSSDFFDEAPRKSMGVINSRDLVEAEEYDVLGEEEKRAEEVKREEPEPPKKEKKKEKKKKEKKEKKEKKAKPEKTETPEKADDAENSEKKEKKEKKKSDGFRVFLAGFLAGCKKFFAGCKSFFTHCGYFIINVSRAIKRRHAKKKRKKAAEARCKRALQRAAEQRAQARNREAQARSRETQREKPRTNGGLVQVRSRGDRRPPSQNGQRRPSSSRPPQKRKPTSSRPPQKRKPTSSRPPQKRKPTSQSGPRRK